MSQKGFLFNQSRCIGCNACTVACKNWNKVDIGPVRWRQARFYELESKKGNGIQLQTVVTGCNHCAEPACLKECPFEAISKDAVTGIVTIDRAKCQSCGTCLESCPFSMSQIADDEQEPTQDPSWEVEHPAQKCTMCPERQKDGLPPVCVAACPTRALKFGDLEELKKIKGAVQLNKKDFPHVYCNNDTETSPSLIIIPKDEITVTLLK